MLPVFIGNQKWYSYRMKGRARSTSIQTLLSSFAGFIELPERFVIQTGVNAQAWYVNTGLLAFRGVFAFVLLAHSFQKMHFWRAEYAGAIPKNILIAFRVFAVIELIGALALFVGIFTQVVALVLIAVGMCTLAIKIRVFKKKFGGEGGWEFDLVVLAGLALLYFLGAGAFSLDHNGLGQR